MIQPQDFAKPGRILLQQLGEFPSGSVDARLPLKFNLLREGVVT